MAVEDKWVHHRGVNVLLAGVLVLGGVVRCWNIRQSFWWDEIWSTMTYVNAPSLWQVVSSIGYYFNNHILYSLAARGFVRVLGESEVAARLPALIMGLLAIIVVFQFGRRFCGTSAGIIAAFLLALSAFHSDHSSEARGYSGLALFALLASRSFLEGIRTGAVKSWLLYILCTVLGCYCHVFMVAVPCHTYREVPCRETRYHFICLPKISFLPLGGRRSYPPALCAGAFRPGR